MITTPLLKFYTKILPPLSDTERTALEAGTVGFEGELFSGKPDWDLLLSQPKPTLTEEEQAYLDAVSYTHLDVYKRQVVAEQLFAGFIGQLDPGQIDVLDLRQVADRGFLTADFARNAFQHPLQHAHVVAEARPQEVAAIALAEPVDVEDLRQLGAIGIE